MNITKPKQTRRHREQTSGYQLGERRGKRQDKNRGKGEEEPRWQRSRTGRTLSPPQIHQKSI